MKNGFLKFPSTPHLALLNGVKVRDDKVMSKSERDDFLRHELVVEEKIDGANLGISFDPDGNIRAQNRGEYLHLPGLGQWRKLDEWLAKRTDLLFENLIDRYIVFGEWCYARHSIGYDQLPDWFLGFDVYDKHNAHFLSCVLRDKFFRSIGLFHVPQIARGQYTLIEMRELLSQSQFTDKPAEGLYLRHDKDDWLVERAKLVRPAFIQTVNQHWSRSGIKANKLRMGL